jgi:hypothetical protein
MPLARAGLLLSGHKGRNSPLNLALRPFVRLQATSQGSKALIFPVKAFYESSGSTSGYAP